MHCINLNTGFYITLVLADMCSRCITIIMKREFAGEHATFEVDQNEDGLAVVTGPEELDIYTAIDARPVIASLVEDEDVAEVIYDASNMDYMDSTGLSIMLGAVRRLREVNKTFLMQNVSSKVMKVLEITDMGKVLLKPEDFPG